MVGEPVTVTASACNFNPKHTLSYSWASTGGKITGKDTTATIDTNGVAGGSYTVTARVSDPKMKKGGEASCTATFTVKEPPKNPPTMSCSANPTSVQAGTPATVTCTCTSPDNVPVTVSGWTASGGSVSGDGGTATLNTTGAACRPDHGERNVYRLSRSDRAEFEHGDGRGSASAAAGGEQAERVRLPQQGEAVARGQHLQGHPGRRCRSGCSMIPMRSSSSWATPARREAQEPGRRARGQFQGISVRWRSQTSHRCQPD